MKRLTVIYEVPDDYNVTRITGTGELNVVRCEWMDALERLAAAEAELQANHPESWAKITRRLTDERDEARSAARILLDDLSQFTRTEWLMERWPWLKDEAAKAGGGE